MIHATPVPLTNEQIRRLRKWLNAEDSGIYRDVLLSNIAQHQADAGRNLIESDDRENQQDEAAADDVHEALPFVHALAIMDEFREQDDRLISLTLSIHPPPQVPNQPT